MRVNRLAEAEIERRVISIAKNGVYPGPIQHLFNESRLSGDPDLHRGWQLSGESLADVIGPLFHYTRSEFLGLIRDANGLRPGAWLTPVPLAACMAPYGLGLAGPADVCLAIDTRAIARVWGPGRARQSYTFPAIWTGSGIEFFVAEQVSYALIVDIFEIEPCGDT